MSARAQVILVVAACAVLPACSFPLIVRIAFHEPAGETYEVKQAPVPVPTPTGRFAAGVAKVDMTPPPGFPTGGHGPAGGLARGHWTRLYARAFFFEDAKGRAVAFVSCDLFALPGGLHDAVASELVMPRRGGAIPSLVLPPAALIIAATHTHQGPGNYMTAKLYNKFGSSYPGFNRALLDFLVERVVTAVREAERNARVGGEVDLVLHAGPAGDLVLNRSPDAFLLNRNAQRMMDDLEATNEGSVPCRPYDGEPDDGWNLPGCPRLRAIDRRMAVLEVRREGKALGLMVFFAVHPTVLDHKAALYSSDFTGLAVGLLEGDGAMKGNPLVVGFFNGAEGDVTARRIRRDIRDVDRLAREFKKSVEGVVARGGSSLGPQPEIRQATERVWVAAEGDSQEGPRCALGAQTYRLPTKANGGVAAFGGGEGDRTILYDLGWRERVRDRPRMGQGPKLPALDSAYLREAKLTDEIVKPADFPQYLPLTLASIGSPKGLSLSIATVPVEASAATGYEIRRSLLEASRETRRDVRKSDEPLPRDYVQIMGLASEYASYAASRDEYMLQDYMGASTLWGPDEGAFLACKLAALQDSLRDAGATYPVSSDQRQLELRGDDN